LPPDHVRRKLSGFRYIGSKARIAKAILDIVGPPQGGFLVDAMSGTGAVALEAARRGWPIRLNDSLTSAVFMSWARLANKNDVPFRLLGGYRGAIRQLNSAKPERGFVWANYSPASVAVTGFERRYFTELNARLIDAARLRIRAWRETGQISEEEAMLLVADLLVAANRVANTAGTYGSFLRNWAPNALREFALVPRALNTRSTPVEVQVGDVADVRIGPDDVGYFDPPYTKRQYAAYYHVLETISIGDEPAVDGVTGLRPWRTKASDFCYRKRALDAIVRAVDGPSQVRSFISYSSRGHVSLFALEARLSDSGTVRIHRVGSVPGYRPNGRMRASVVDEYLVEYVRSATVVESAA
jgi:adenine-specific DNA-methyltransferase